MCIVFSHSLAHLLQIQYREINISLVSYHRSVFNNIFKLLWLQKAFSKSMKMMVMGDGWWWYIFLFDLREREREQLWKCVYDVRVYHVCSLLMCVWVFHHFSVRVDQQGEFLEQFKSVELNFWRIWFSLNRKFMIDIWKFAICLFSPFKISIHSNLQSGWLLVFQYLIVQCIILFLYIYIFSSLLCVFLFVIFLLFFHLSFPKIVRYIFVIKIGCACLYYCCLSPKIEIGYDAYKMCLFRFCSVLFCSLSIRFSLVWSRFEPFYVLCVCVCVLSSVCAHTLTFTHAIFRINVSHT